MFHLPAIFRSWLAVIAWMIVPAASLAATGSALPEHFCAECGMIRVSGVNALATGPQGPLAVGGTNPNAQVMGLGLNIAGLLARSQPLAWGGSQGGPSPVGFPSARGGLTPNWTDGQELPGAFQYVWKYPETRFDPTFIY